MAETGLLTNPELFDEKWISFHTLPAALWVDDSQFTGVRLAAAIAVWLTGNGRKVSFSSLQRRHLRQSW
jgi:hypothetical protein